MFLSKWFIVALPKPAVVHRISLFCTQCPSKHYFGRLIGEKTIQTGIDVHDLFAYPTYYYMSTMFLYIGCHQQKPSLTVKGAIEPSNLENSLSFALCSCKNSALISCTCDS